MVKVKLSGERVGFDLAAGAVVSLALTVTLKAKSVEPLVASHSSPPEPGQYAASIPGRVRCTPTRSCGE